MFFSQLKYNGLIYRARIQYAHNDATAPLFKQATKLIHPISHWITSVFYAPAIDNIMFHALLNNITTATNKGIQATIDPINHFYFELCRMQFKYRKSSIMPLAWFSTPIQMQHTLLHPKNKTTCAATTTTSLETKTELHSMDSSPSLPRSSKTS